MQIVNLVRTMPEIHGSALPAPQVEAHADSLVSRVSDMILRMKGGSPIVRYLEVGTSGTQVKPEVTTCMAYLSDNLTEVRFVSNCSEGSDKAQSVCTLSLSKVEQVEASNIDKFAVALLLPDEMQITELIFATESDWSCWLYGLKVLCSQEAQPVSEPDANQISDLYNLIDELQTRNDLLVRIKAGYELSLSEMTDMMNEKDTELASLKSLLQVRDRTIRELSGTVASLVEKQNTLSNRIMSNPVVSLRPHRAAVHEGELGVKTAASTGSFEYGGGSIKGLENLEQQLRKLDQRKQQLERLLATVGGA